MSAVVKKTARAILDVPGVSGLLNVKKQQTAAARPAPAAAPAAAAKAAAETSPAAAAVNSVRTRSQSRSSARRSGGVKLLMSPSRGPAGGDADGQTTLGVKGTLKS